MPAKKPPQKVVKTEEIENPPLKSPRTFWYVLLLIVSVVVLAISIYLVWKNPFMGWEQRIFTYINNFPEGWRMAAIVITYIGSTWMAVAVVALTSILRMYWLTWRLAASILAGYVVILVLKTWLERPRPEFLYDGAHVRVGETLAGFPSGHSMLITVMVLTLLPFLPKIWRWIGAALLIVLVTLSRIYLGVHAPLDIAAGVAIGAIVVCIIRLLPPKIAHFFRLG